MTHDEAVNIEMTGVLRPVRYYRKALQALDTQGAQIRLQGAEQSYRIALLGGDKAAIERADRQRQLARYDAERETVMAASLPALIDDAKARDAALSAQVKGMRSRQKRGLEVGAELHDAVVSLMALVDEFTAIETELREFNSAASRAGRSDLYAGLPIEMLAQHLGVSPGELPQPNGWSLGGYEPGEGIDMVFNNVARQNRFDRFR